MKKLLVTTLLTTALAASVFAQGTVTFAGSAAHGLVQYSPDQGNTVLTIPAGNPASVGTYGQLNIAVYSAAVGTANPLTASTPSLLPAAWAESTTVLHQIAPLAGNTPTYTFTLGNIAGGASGEVMLLAWTGTFTDWNSAFTAAQAAPNTVLLGWTGSTFPTGLPASTGLLSWQNGTGNPGGSPATPAIPLTYGAAAGYNGLVLFSTIPEPSTFALAGLGAAALMIFRRRK